MPRGIRSRRLGALAIALSGLALLGFSISTWSSGSEVPREPGASENEEDRVTFVLDGENLDRVLWRLFDEEFRKDDAYIAGLAVLPEDEHAAVLTENYYDLAASLEEHRRGEHDSFDAAVDQFRRYSRWLKSRVLESPRRYLEEHGAYRVTEKDLREWTSLFVDAFSDEDHVSEALTALPGTIVKDLYDHLPEAAMGELEELRGTEFPSLEAKKSRMRQRLFALRDRIAADPEVWLESVRRR